MMDVLPTEILMLILDQVAVNRQDLKRFCEVSLRLYHVATPYLYRSVVLSGDGMALHQLTRLLEQIPGRHLVHTKELGFDHPIYGNFADECIIHHAHPWNIIDFHERQADREDYDMDTDENLLDIATKDALDHFMQALESLPLSHNQLESFRFDLRSCIPDHLLSTNNSIVINQSNSIQSISIQTPVRCDKAPATRVPVDLVQFKSLRSFCWRNLTKYCDFQSVKDCFRVHSHQIERLTLDLMDWWYIQTFENPGLNETVPRRWFEDFFAQTVLNLSPGSNRIVFPALQHLDLWSVPFDDFTVEMFNAFNMRGLKSLRLGECSGCFELLCRLDKQTTFQLTSLELRIHPDMNRGEIHFLMTAPICRFVRQCPRLESLFLSFSGPIDWECLAKTISGCRYLRRFIMDYTEPFSPVSSSFARVLQEKKLTCFGTTKMFPSLVFVNKPLCKLLHLREELIYQEYMKDLTEWAFSPRGFLGIEVLALGDFSLERKYGVASFLFCRSGDGYRRLKTLSEASSLAIVRNNMDMLKAWTPSL